jgi:hypothetical protein
MASLGLEVARLSKDRNTNGEASGAAAMTGMFDWITFDQGRRDFVAWSEALMRQAVQSLRSRRVQKVLGR